MNNNYQDSQAPLEKGIKMIGIGKHGSKNLPDSLIHEILTHLQSGKANHLLQGAFFGALITKGATEGEYQLEEYVGKGGLHNPEQLLKVVCPDTPAAMQEIGVKLLSGESLNETEAEKLGNLLFSEGASEAFRAMAASILRIRYETDEEYKGLMAAAENSFASGFKEEVSASQPLIQLAEPFDGVEHSYMITPIVAYALQQRGYITVVSTGRSGGPKLTLNTLDIYASLNGSFLKRNKNLGQEAPPFGWVLNQALLSPALDRWVERRRTIIKRPFLATLEKVLNPCKASILITSVFHITYMEKMVELGEMAGFSGVIVLKRGLEGTLAPSIAKASGILCAAKQPDGTWLKTEIDADTEEFSRFRDSSDAVVEPLVMQDNIRLINQFITNGQTGNEDFDKRAKLAIALYNKGLDWLEEKGGISS